MASPIHTEIKFLNSGGDLLIRPDILVMNERSLSLVNDDEQRLIARKGFVFYGSALFIEIKFCKSSTGINSTFCESVVNDCEKLEEIRSRLYPDEEEAEMSGCVVVFNKTNLRCPEFDALLEEKSGSRVSKVIYATASFGENILA